ncbi:MAG TPA: hypothetical protein VMR18_01455 [Candidatus Saccharimonadales bacterium]|nr:hypothetical protein [Candidatus Saccharimonadales bacterium]
MKSLIWISLTVVSTVFSWIGDLIGHGWLSAWSLGLGFIGCFVGIWLGYKIAKNYL